MNNTIKISCDFLMKFKFVLSNESRVNNSSPIRGDFDPDKRAFFQSA